MFGFATSRCWRTAGVEQPAITRGTRSSNAFERRNFPSKTGGMGGVIRDERIHSSFSSHFIFASVCDALRTSMGACMPVRRATPGILTTRHDVNAMDVVCKVQLDTSTYACMQTLPKPMPAFFAAHDKANLIALAARRRKEHEHQPQQRLMLLAHDPLHGPPPLHSNTRPVWSAIHD